MKHVASSAIRVARITWVANHHIVHLLLGYCWYVVASQWVGQRSGWYLFLALLGSELPDIEHILYFYIFGKQDTYSKIVRDFFKKRQLGDLAKYVKNNHKHGLELRFHSAYWAVIIIAMAYAALWTDSRSLFVLLGAVAVHYVFDMVDDLLFLGRLNANWKRFPLRRSKRSHVQQHA